MDGWMEGWLDEWSGRIGSKEGLSGNCLSSCYPSAFFPFYRNGPQTQGTETEPLGPGPPSSL